MEDYFSIEDILSTEPRVYATMRVRGHKLAHLDATGVAAHHATHADKLDGETMDDLPEQHRLALPFWLLESLTERALTTVHLPRCFSAPTQNALRADARCVSLHERCPAYYALGARLARLLRDATLPDVLQRAYAARAWHVVDGAVFSGARGVEALQMLDRLERRLFYAAHGAEIAKRRWKERRNERIASCDSVLGKRRHLETEASPVTPRMRVN